MFRRRREPDRPAPSPDGPRDEDLPMLSVDQAVALYGLMAFALAAHGVEADTDFDGSFTASDGRVFGLHNLAVLVAAQPFAQWHGTVMRHVEGLLDPDPEAPADPSHWLLKLRAFADLPEPLDYDAASPLPGLAVLAAIDTPAAVHELLSRANVERHAPVERFHEQALVNLRALPAPEVTTLRADPERADSDVLMLATDDFFGAARVLVWEHLLATHLLVERPARGVLVAVPNRHLLTLHPITGPGVFAALELMSRLAHGEYGSRPGPVSTEVFHLPLAGPGQVLTEQAEDGGVRVRVEGGFAAVIESLDGP